MNRDNDKYTIMQEIGFSLLAEGKTIRAKADGYSMYPSIRPRSVITLEPVREDTVLAPGEIIAWKRESGFVLHRLKEIIKSGDKTVFITRGDSCLREDSPLTRDQIAGRVLLVEDENGKTREGSQLVRKPCYFYNSVKIWILLRLYHLNSRRGG